MSVVSTILFALIWGFAIGAGGRWLVPGPDPMPGWLTTAIGIAGSLAGASVIVSVAGLPETAGEAYGLMWAAVGASLIASGLLVVAYRRFLQKRPLAGRGAQRLPTSGIGVARIRRRLGVDHPAVPAAERDVAERLRKLGELREGDVITEEEFAAKRAELIAEI